MKLTSEQINYCLDFAEGKTYLKYAKTSKFPESLLPSYPEFYAIWNEFWKLLSPILDLEFYDVFFNDLGDGAYYRYRQVGIDTVRDFLMFCCSHTKRESNILLRESNPKSYTRDICFNRLRKLIDECCLNKCPHREEVVV